VLAYLFPDEADLYLAKGEDAARSRLVAGVQYPSDVEAGLALGRAVAEKLIERAEQDGSDAVWDGEAHTEPGAWTWAGDSPFMPVAGTWQPWLLTSNDQLRPPPPPAYDSPERAAELMEVKNYTRTFASNAVAFFWQSHPGVKAYWFETAGRLIAENRLDDNPPYSSLIYAALSVGMADSFIACWEAKYHYWTIRPWQLDPEITTNFPSPNHPSYPAAHGCNSGAGETVMAGFFPADGDALISIGEEGIQSRLWAGIHYQSDSDEGSKIGQLAAQMAVDHAKAMMQP
jgi:membrane-associated phospholipid phosphatase